MHIHTPTITATAYAGSKCKLANMLEITRQSVQAWGSTLPQTAAQKLYILTNGEVGEYRDENSQTASD